MRVGVPGEFHEDRWQRTAEDSERLVDPAHTGSERAVGYKLSRGEGGLLDGLRHGALAHRYFSANPAWRGGLLATLRHGDPSHRYLSAIPAWRRGQLSALRPLFVTATLPASPSVASPRGEGVFLPVFVTVPLPTGTSVASSRGEDGLLSPLVHEMSLSHGCRGPDLAFVHEKGLSHGRRTPDRVFRP